MTTAILLFLAADISGHVTGASAKTEVRIRGEGLEVKGAKPDAKGSFVFRGVSGYSLVEAFTWQGKNLTYAWADWKGSPVELTLAPVKPLTGKVSGLAKLPAGLKVSAPGEMTVPVSANGSFNLGVLPPDEYELELEGLQAGVKASGLKIDTRRRPGPVAITLSR